MRRSRVCRRTSAAAKVRLSDFEIVRRSSQFAVGPVGFAATTTPTEAAFRRMLQSPGSGEDFRKLLKDATIAGQTYALLGLKLLGDPAYAATAARFKVSRNQIVVAGGCVVANRPVSEIAKQIDRGELK